MEVWTVNCRTTLLRLDAYIDGELSQYEHAAVKQHLQGCESCNEQHQWLQVLKFELARMPDAMPDREFEERLLAKTFLAAQTETVRRTRWWMSMAAAAAIVCALGMSFKSSQEAESQALISEREREMRLDQDRLIHTDSDPLSGSSVILPASYGP